MSALAWATIVVFGILLAAVAICLLVIVALLWRTRSTLDDVVGALDAVAGRAAPFGDWLRETNGPLAVGRDAIEAVAPPAADEGTAIRTGAVS